MHIRLRIIVLFTVLVMLILGLVCGGIYYFSYTARLNTIQTRLTNRAMTTARLLSQKDYFNQKLVQQIDSLTKIALKNKTVQAYDTLDKRIYCYNDDNDNDTIHVTKQILNRARASKNYFFTDGVKEAVAIYYTESNNRLVVVSGAEDKDGRHNLYTLLQILLLSFLVGTAFVLIAGYFFASRIMKPIKKITADVRDISAQNLSRRIATGQTRDEWFELASTLNELLNRLQDSFDLQSRFISNASHELSTPLTSIISQLEVSLQKEREANEYKKVMSSIHQDVRHISKLTQTLLEFAKASGKPGGLEINLIRIDEILLQLPVEMFKIDASYKAVLEFGELPENEQNLLVFGNEPLLLTAIKNIVLNACKYSDDHRAIIFLSANKEKISVQVKNTGKVIPETELKTIFQPFYRANENHNKEGFGLGLSLADRIIKLHKGTITVSSDQIKGTCFTINLPPANALK